MVAFRQRHPAPVPPRARILRATGIPYAVTVHGGEFMVGARLFRPLMQQALGEAAVVLPVSTFTQGGPAAPEGPPPTEVVTPGVDPARSPRPIRPRLIRPDSKGMPGSPWGKAPGR